MVTLPLSDTMTRVVVPPARFRQKTACAIELHSPGEDTTLSSLLTSDANGPAMSSDNGGFVDRRTHWERVYSTRAPEGVSWFQAEPTVSARLIDAAGLRPDT